MRLNSDQAIKLAERIYQAYGNWDIVRKCSVYDPERGVWIIKHPPPTKARVEELVDSTS